MKLYLKKFDVSAGRPVIFLHIKTTLENNISVGDRVEISFHDKKIIGVVDIVEDFLKKNEIALSEDIELCIVAPFSAFYNDKGTSGIKFDTILHNMCYGNADNIKKLEEVGKIKKMAFPEVILSVPRATAAIAASEILQNFPVTDLNIEETPIEDVIRKVFRRNK